MIGKTGNHAQGRVGLVHNNVCARAPDHAQLLAGETVLATVVKRGLAKEYLAQVKMKLRTVPTNTEVFLCGLWLCGKSRSQQGLLESKKKIGGNHAFFRDN